MIRFGLFSLIAAALALSSSAQAAEGARGAPFGEVKVFGGAGASVETTHREVSAELVRAGWAALPPASLGYRLGFGLGFYGISLDLRLGGFDKSLPGPEGSGKDLEDHRLVLGAELGYRLWLGRRLSLSPHVGLTWLRSTLCFAGQPDASSSISRPPFEQILRNPGRGTCLVASDAGLDVGLSLAWNHRIDLGAGKDETAALYLSVGPRVSYTLPFSSSRTWERGPTSDLQVDFPPFEGPTAPLGSAYAGLEFQVRFAIETLLPGQRASGAK